MILDPTRLQQLNESDLRTRVLLPLFMAMGFRDVTDNHGAHEGGKDILMWKPDIVKGRENYAVVVKAVPITSRNRLDVQDQVLRSFGEGFNDPISGNKHDVDRVIVLSSKRIAAPTKDAIRSFLRPQNFDLRCDFIDGSTLSQHLSSFMSRELLWDALDQARRVLSESFGDLGVGLHLDVAGNRTIYFVEESTTAASVPLFSVSSTAPTPESIPLARSEHELSGLLLKGLHAEIPADRLDIELPSFLQMLIPDGQLTSVVVGPSVVDPPLGLSLHVDGNQGAQFQLPYVEFRSSYGWKDQVVFSNQGQALPFILKLYLSRATPDQGTVKITTREDVKVDAVLFHEISRLKQVMREGGKVTLMDLRRLPVLDLTFPANPEVVLPEGVLELSRRLALLQERARVPLELEDLPFAADELADIYKASDVVENGYYVADQARLTFELERTAALDPSKICGVGIPITITSPRSEVIRVLDRDIDLGPSIIRYEGPAEDVSSTPEAFNVTIQATPEHPLQLHYPKWQQARGETAETS